jgi:transposase
MLIPHPYDLVIGLDRADKKADLHLIDTRTLEQTALSIDTAPEALWDWLLELRRQHPQARVALCLEQPAGHLISFLEAYQWITLYPINPITLQNFRQAFVTSRARDDLKDADYAAHLLLAHHDKLKAWAPEDSATRAVQQLVARRRALVDERTALTNRLQGLLKQYFPHALQLCGQDLWRPLATGFLLKWPTLHSVQKARPASLIQFYHLNGSRSQQLLQQRLTLIGKAVPVTDQPELIQSLVLRVQLIARQLQLLQRTLREFDSRIAQAYEHHPDYFIFASLPGAGPTLGSRLLGSLGSQRERYPCATNLQCYTGIAPVTKKSGNSCHIHRRYLCSKFHKQSFHEYAKESILWCRWAAAYYLQQRLKGSSHHTAVRALAYKWQRVILRCWHNHTPYSDQHYEATLRRRNSPIVKLFDQVQLGKSPFKNPAKKS